MHCLAYYSVYYSLDIEATYAPINRWFDKDGVYIHNWLLPDHKKECSLNTWNKMYGNIGYYGTWNNPDSGRQMSYNFTFMYNLKNNIWTNKSINNS